jgi:hypothetical protein
MTAEGDNVTYEWFHNDVSIGAPSATRRVRIREVNPAVEGQYHCIVRNRDGEVVSEPVDVVIPRLAPQFEVQPSAGPIRVEGVFSVRVRGMGVTVVNLPLHVGTSLFD